MASQHETLPRRERQAMDILYRLGHGSAEDVQREMPDQPSYSAVRSLLMLLVDKGLLKHSRESRRYVYTPTASPARVRQSALKSLLKTFFDGSPGKLVANLLDSKEMRLPPEELAAIRQLLDEQASAEKGK